MTGNLVITGQTLYEVIDPAPFTHNKYIKHVDLRRGPAAYLVLFRTAIMVCNCFGAFSYVFFERCYPSHTAKRAAPLLGFFTLMADVFPWFVGGEHEVDQTDIHYGLAQWS